MPNDIERRLEILETVAFGHSGRKWHKTWVEGGWMFGKLGSRMWVIDPVSKRPVSQGFHIIEMDSSGTGTATKGTLIEWVTVDLRIRVSEGEVGYVPEV